MSKCILVAARSALAAVAFVGGVLNNAEASFISDASGNTRTTRLIGGDGTLNFAVFDLQDQDLPSAVLTSFAPGAGSDSSLTTGNPRYLYVYQVLNDGSVPCTVDYLNVDLGQVPISEIKAWGSFPGLSLKDDGGVVGAAAGLTDNRLNAFGMDDTPFTIGGSATIGVTAPSFDSTLTDLESPYRVRPVTHYDQNVLTVGFEPIFNYNTPGQKFRSALFGFTTDFAPKLAKARFTDGMTCSTAGGVVAPVPEPATWALLLAAGPALLGVYIRRRVAGR